MAVNPKILLIEDDTRLAANLRQVLEDEGFAVRHCTRGDEGLRLAAVEAFEVVLTDLRLPGVGGLELVRQLHQAQPRLPVVLMTAHGTIETAIEATKLGAYDYLQKPFEMQDLLGLLTKAAEASRLMREPVALDPAPAARPALLGVSRLMQQVCKEVGRLAAKPVSVLIRGETGTGKELIARALYQHSDRARAPFIAVNCAAIPETLLESELFGHERGAFTGADQRRIGRFEQAHQGTLFLDEIGDLTPGTQVKLLRVLQEKCIQRLGSNETIPVDVRILAATHRDLETMMREGHFREDLFYRLSVATIELPPLRARREDIPLLAQHFLLKNAAEFDFEPPRLMPEAVALLQNDPWPGNVRELENVIRRLLLASRGLPIDGATVREALARRRYGRDILRCLRDVSDERLPTLLSNLGGHDLQLLIDKLHEAERTTDRPSVIFAYTIKGYGLPIYGDPANHAALLSTERINELRASFGLTEATQWDGFDPDSPEGRLCAERGRLLRLKERARDIPPVPVRAEDVPDELNATATPVVSTQEAFGRAMMRLADVPKVGPRIVTSSADVAVSTNLGGWINKVGTFTLRETTDYEAGRARILNWQLGSKGQHIEMGIAEMNLFSLIGQMGMAHELMGQLLFPIGTVYDPFVCRGLDAIIYGLYSGAKFIFVATPSGVTLAPEGGAHQSSVTSSLGIELPELDYYEPTFAIEVEWALCEAIKQCCDRQHGRSSYLRLSTKPIEQALLEPVIARLGKDELRRQFLAGGYVVHRSPTRHDPRAALHIVTTGVMLPEAIEATQYLESEGVAVNLINLTSPRRAYDDWHAAQQRGDDVHHLATLIPEDAREAPILTVHDAAPHALAWVGSVFGQKTRALGVTKFGQSGYRADLYRYFHIDTESIIKHGFELVDEAL
ncbi:MAG: sigma 54-interacting transcriptional regulator [Anaerolineales bacterium]|nr:sigma 54-interacting transcriptional regulator [Anaerolineales bacterium]